MRKQRQRLLSRFLMAIVAYASLGSFAGIMTSLDHNEPMYVAAGVLFSQGKALYRDFAYLQTPYLPVLYGSAYKVLSIDTYYLLTAKLFSVVFLAVSALAVLALARRVLGDKDRALCVVALFLLNGTILRAAREVSNYILPVAASLLGAYVLEVSLGDGRIRPWLIALAGLLAAIAVGTKLTYAAIVPAILAVLLLYRLVSTGSGTRPGAMVMGALLPFLAGVLMGTLPAFLCFLRDPASFVFNNWGYHSVNTAWRLSTGYAGPMAWTAKLRFARDIFFRADNLVVVIGILAGVALGAHRLQTIRPVPVGALLACALVLAGVPAALAPTPSFPQYYAVPVSFLFLLLAHSGAGQDERARWLHTRLLVILVLLATAFVGPGLLRSIADATHRDRWSGLHIHDVSVDIRDALIGHGVDPSGKVATLSPLYAIEANLPIYRELATGPFLYRVGDMLTAEQRRQFVGSSPSTIDELFDEDPPSAILVGYEREKQLDEPLTEYARDHRYREVSVAGLADMGTLYVRP